MLGTQTFPQWLWGLDIPFSGNARTGNFNAIREQFYDSLWKKCASQLNARLTILDGGILKLEREDRTRFLHKERVMLDTPVTLALAGNKFATLKVLRAAGVECLPKPMKIKSNRWRDAIELLEFGPVVVKPAADTGGGRGVTTGVSSVRSLSAACKIAARYGREILIEAQIQGDNYRLLFLNGELLDIVRRDPPEVLGDGISTIRQLVAQENQSRIESVHTRALSPLEIDLDMRLYLRERGLSAKTVPASNERVVVKRVCNQNAREQNHRIPPQIVHPQIIETCRKAVKAMQLQLAGVDLIAARLDAPLELSGGILGEVNSTPGLHHHLLTKSTDMGQQIVTGVLDFCFQMRCVGDN